MSSKILSTAALVLGASISAASAAPMTGTFGFSIYSGTGPGSESDATQQALITNPLITPADLLQATSYTGAINFSEPSGPDTIGAFLATGGGVFTPALTSATAGTTLSTAGFTKTSVFVITGTTASGLSGSISHDDGVSVYQGGVAVTPAGSAAPTTEVPTAFTLAPGAYEIVYVESNGLPADLIFSATPTATPEPASLAVLGAGLLGLGGLVRRRRG